MAEVWFYNLTSAPLDKTLPTLVERSLSRGWRVAIRAGSPERLAALDDLLWTYDEESFLPHGLATDEDPETQPVLLTLEDGLANGADVLFLTDSTPLPALWPKERVIMLFDGQDPDAVAHARAAWKEAKNLHHDVQYWLQDEGGRWARKA